LALPEYEHVVFRRAPLTKVIGQVRFPVLPRFADGNFVSPFHEAVRIDYPSTTREQQMSLRMSMGEGMQTGIPETQWRFNTRDKLWSVVLADGAITIETTTGYTDSSEFVNRFRDVVTLGMRTLNISEQVRLGVRFINHIRHPGGKALADWAGLLRQEFVGFAASDLLEGSIEHMIQELHVNRPDGTFVVRHGLLSGVNGQMPGVASESDRFYLIDLDYFDGTERPLDIHATAKQMEDYIAFMYRFFRWTLGPELYDYLEPSSE
jgi:uncharacterized protein (TIGR04255 family)